MKNCHPKDQNNMRVLYLFPNPRRHQSRRQILNECLKKNYPDTLLLGLTRFNNFNIEYGLLDSAGFFGQIRPLLMLKNYDLIVCKDVTSGFFIGVLKKWNLIKKPVIFLDIVVHKKISGVKLRFLRYILSGSERVIYCASSLKEILQDYFKITDRVLKYIPWSVDSIFFYPLKAEQQQFVFSAGDNDRDYLTLIEAIRNTGLELKIATNLPFKKSSQGIEIAPWLHPSVLKQEYAQAKFIVVPLYNVPSASGATTLLESMAMAKAVIVSDSCGIRDFVKDGHDALVVKPRDILSLRKAIIYLNENPQERERLGVNARLTVEKYFNTAKQADSLIEAYRQVLKR